MRYDLNLHKFLYEVYAPQFKENIHALT